MKSSDPSPNYLINISQGVAVLIPAGFIVSAVYDWGFFYALDLNFNEIPTTITDHFRTGILWFPPLIALIVFYYAIEFQFQRVEMGLTEEEIIASSKNPEKLRRFRGLPYKLFAWIAPLGVLNYFLIGDIVAGSLPLFLTISWVTFADWCYSARLIQLRRNKNIQTAFTLIPVVAFLAFFSGYNNSITASQHKPKEFSIVLTSKGENVEGKILRSFEKGILLLSSVNKISFVPWPQIRSLEFKNPYKPYEGMLCSFFNICRKNEDATK